MKYIYYIYEDETKTLIGTAVGVNVKAAFDFIRDNYGWTGLHSGKSPITELPKTMRSGYIYGRTSEKHYKKLLYVRETIKALNTRNKILT